MKAILYSVKKWKHYLIRRKFKVNKNHDSLKYLLEKILSSKEQQKWVPQIQGFDFEIIYKNGKDNVIVDVSLYRIEESSSLYFIKYFVQV